MIKVAILGYGTVGSGVADVIDFNNEEITKRLGEEIQVAYILDLRDFPGDRNEHKVVHDINAILEDDEVSIVCETMGGVGAAYKFTKAALEKGKSVCSSNKELVAMYGPELLKCAAEHSCNYMFEASCGGGIPIIRPLNTCLTAEKITALKGILNGTTNFILTKMDKEGADFDEVLKEAQKRGYAEANPEADVEGHDAGRKIAILSSLMMGKNVAYDNVYKEGITKISSRDFAYAKALGKSIKLLAISSVKDDALYCMVAPHMISTESPLYGVSGVFNALLVESNMLGETMYYGKGAGKEATASAVVGDVIDCVRYGTKQAPCVWEDEELVPENFNKSVATFFVRVPAADKAQVAEFFGDVTEVKAGFDEEYAFVTGQLTEAEFSKKAQQVGSVINRIRVES